VIWIVGLRFIFFSLGSARGPLGTGLVGSMALLY
jgi:hypothetical protein